MIILCNDCFKENSEELTIGGMGNKTCNNCGKLCIDRNDYHVIPQYKYKWSETEQRIVNNTDWKKEIPMSKRIS